MTVKPIVFCTALATAVMTAGTPALALSGFEGQEHRGNVMVLDGRGGQLGVRVEDTTNGVRIGEVTPGGAAEKAGIKEGDVVVDYDGERVRSARQLTRLVQETANGRSVKIGIQRNGQKQSVDATPESRNFSFDMRIDGDQIRRDIERSVEGLQEFKLGDMIPSSRGRLGVTVQSLSPQLAEYFGAKEGGALVSSVTKDSAAEKAGLKAGDVITSIDGDTVRDADALTSEISGKSGDISIGIVRDKKATTIKVPMVRTVPGVPKG